MVTECRKQTSLLLLIVLLTMAACFKKILKYLQEEKFLAINLITATRTVLTPLTYRTQ
jgi:hypothetical protein